MEKCLRIGQRVYERVAEDAGREWPSSRTEHVDRNNGEDPCRINALYVDN